MNILHINTFDSGGGAAKLCRQLVKELTVRHISTWMAVKHRRVSNTRIAEIQPSTYQKIVNKLLNTESLAYRTYDALTKLPYWKDIDVVHFHNLHGGYFNIFDLPRITREKPCVWTLHDPWILEHRTALVPEYEPIFKRNNPLLRAAYARAIRASRISFVTPSRWLAGRAAHDYPDQSITVIPNGVDTNIFHPSDRENARIALNLPLDKTIVLSVAHGGAGNIYKGGHYIETLKNTFQDDAFLFIAIGDAKTYVKDESILSQYYVAADVLVYPSLADNAPLVVIEAMACGTPVVAFNTGGISEIIDHTINGYVAAYKDSRDLAKGLQYVLDNREALSAQARNKAVLAFDSATMAESYIRAYTNLIEKKV